MVSKTRVNLFTPKALTLGVLSLLFFSGCQQQAAFSGERFVSAKGVKIEAMLPADTFMLAKFGSRDEKQLENLKILNAYFPNDPMGSIVREFNAGFKDGANLEEIGLDYEQDILPILNDKSEVYFAISPKAGADGAEELPINAALALTLVDEAKFDALLAKQIEKNLLKKNDYNGQAYYTEVDVSDTPAFIARVNDTVFVTTSLDILQSGLDNLKSGKNLLAENKVYQRIVNKYHQPAIALIYADFAKVTEFLAESSAEGKEMLATINSATPKEINVDDIESEILLLIAEGDGLRLSAHILGRDGKDFTQLASNYSKAYLADKIPAQAPVIYTENANLRKSYEVFLGIAQQDPDFDQAMAELKSFLGSQQLDLEKDILSFLDRGFALLLEDNSSVIPSIGFYLDVGSNPDGASKVMAKINQAIDQAFEQAKLETPELPMLVDKEEVVAGRLWKFRLNFDAVLTQAPPEVAKKLTGQKVEFYYGILDGNILAFALKPDLEKVFGKDKSVAQGEEYRQAMSYLKGADRSVGYMAPAQVFVYLDRLLKLAEDAGAMDRTSLAEYELAKSYLMPLKSLSFGTAAPEKDHIYSEAFLHIGK